MDCDFCGSSHATEKCQMLLLQDQNPRFKDLNDGVHLAYKSLPSWVQVNHGADGKTHVVTHQRLPRYTRLGPLIAPQKPKLISNALFPLKICHGGGGVTYLDLSRKEHCSWLSLITQGSEASRNLLVCQIDDLLYYVASEDIPEKAELRVWYSPFYQKKILEELRSLSEKETANNLGQLPVEPEFRLPPSLTQIAVGKSQVTFTHNLCGGEENNHLIQPLNAAVRVNNRGIVSGDGYIHSGGVSCRYLQREQTHEKPDDCRKLPCNASSSGMLAVPPTIEVIASKPSPKEPDKVVTFIIEAVKSSASVTASLMSSLPHIEHSASDELSLDESSDEEKEKTPSTFMRKPYKVNKVKKETNTADSHVVKQLPARALGVSLPRPWCCRYCGDHFSKPLAFAHHIKAHLRWIIWRRFNCEDCSQTFQSSVLLQNHKTASHSCGAFSPVVPENKGETEVSVKHETVSDEEHMDGIESSEDKQSTKKTLTLPTKFVKGPHNCQICPKQFHKAEYLLRHLRKHTGDFTCQKCLKVFARKEGLQKHVCPNGYHQESLECSLCNRAFFNPSLLQQHYLKHKGSKKCTRCGHFFSHIGSLEKHMKSCPSVEINTSFQCSICSKEFVNQSLLERHMSSHSRQHHCEVCNKTYNSNASLQQHLPFCRQVQQIISNGHVKCEECGEVSSNVADFRSHYQKHTHPFNCSGCSHRFRTRVGYEVHVCKVELHCDQCDAEFRSVQALNRHSAVHGPPPFTCLSCRRSFYRKESLDRHACSFKDEMKAMAPPKGNSSFKCNICGVILATRHSYNTHVKGAHGGSAAKEFSCELCGKKFYRKDLLREHAVVHTPPSHPCPECKKLFKTRKSLEVHSMLHLGIKRFTCKYCNKKYHQKGNLAKHERSHMPRGAVKCQYCGFQCLTTDDLKAHLLSHTVVKQELTPKQQKELNVLPDKETIHVAISQVCNDVEVESPQQKQSSVSFSGINTGLKVISSVVGGISAERIFADTGGSLLEANHNLQMGAERIHLEVNSKVNEGHALAHDFRTNLVHVSGVTKDAYEEQNAVPHPQMGGSSTVFIPQRISNVCLPTSVQPVKEKCAIEKEEHFKLSKSIAIEGPAATFQNENSSAFSSNMCDITDDVHISGAPDVTISGAAHTYHLNLDDNCQVTVERRHEHFDHESYVHFDSQPDPNAHEPLNCNSPPIEQELVYEPNTTVVSRDSVVTGSLKCHVLNNHQMSENVVIMASTHEDGMSH